MDKQRIKELAEQGVYIEQYTRDYKCFADLDGSEARRFLESKGFEVIANRDTGRNGVAITGCGISLSTNGYIHITHKN